MSENAGPQPDHPAQQWPPISGAPGPNPVYQQPPFEQPPGAAGYPPPPQYSPGYGLQPTASVPGGDWSTASMAHWLPILVGLWGPLILMLTTGTRDSFVRAHAVESLNFSLTLIITNLVLLVSGFFLLFIPWLFIPVVGIVALVLHIMAAVAASRGELYRYPAAIRMVS